MNDLDLCSEVVSRSCQPLRYIRRWISRKPLEIEAWFQKTTNRKWHMGYQMVTWPWKVKLVTPIRLERNISKTAGDRDSVPKKYQYEMAYGLSNSHVIDDEVNTPVNTRSVFISRFLRSPYSQIWKWSRNFEKIRTEIGNTPVGKTVT